MGAFKRIKDLSKYVTNSGKHSVNGGLIAYRVRTAAKSRWSG